MKHYEDCEQLFLSIGKCFVVEAFLEFFDMDDETQKPLKNAPNLDASTSDEQKKIDIKNILDKFLDQYIFVAEDEEDPLFGSDGVCCYSVNVLHRSCYLLILKMLSLQEMASIYPPCISSYYFTSSLRLVSTTMQLRC